MRSDETFEAVAPLRTKILRLLAEKPMGFSELKRELGIKSSGKLDFHLKKLGSLVALNSDGRYTLTREGYVALQAIATIRRYGWQKRAYIIGAAVYIAATVFILSRILVDGVNTTYVLALILATM